MFFDVLDEIDEDPGWRYQHRRSCAWGLDILIAVEILEPFGYEKLIGFVKVVNVYADSRNIVGKLHFGLGDIELEAARVFHDNAADVLLAYPAFVVVLLEAERAEYLCEPCRVVGDDLRVECSDLHFDLSFGKKSIAVKNDRE